MSEGLSSSSQFPLAGYNSATAKPTSATTSDPTAAAGRDSAAAAAAALEPRHGGHAHVKPVHAHHAMHSEEIEAEGRPPYIHGASALFYGYKATLYRDLPFSALQFMFWEQFQAWSRVYKQSRDIGVPLELLTGAAAGGLAGVITCPLDVVKTRLQTQVNTPSAEPEQQPSSSAHRPKDPNPQKRLISTSSPSTHRPKPGAIALKTSSVLTGLRVIYHTEGVGGWFRGVGPRGVWTFIQSGCMLFLYQRLLHKLEVWMPLDSKDADSEAAL
ncbi:mitochondrial carrier [Trichoderma longibrachiatum ATCC 18648]|uniref:Mitochondrial carrier n=1 Tax=Trichoderma longibrachiatum ATCC 18648 TaxID=983965 RepID=A0A2T4CDP2_TRILO|nr:mitochondrial carrier [Trichoderma longibrachiatum ATCC 18648]